MQLRRRGHGTDASRNRSHAKHQARSNEPAATQFARSTFLTAVLSAVLATLLTVLLTACTADGDDAARPGPLAELDSTTVLGADVATGGPEAQGTGTLRWADCDEDELAGLECATLDVPLDHADPDGDTIELALARRPAGGTTEAGKTPADQRIGSLLLNPGGPGGSGVELVPQLAAVMSDEILDRFDLVGFDPRGVSRSTPVECIEDQETLNALDGDPDNQAEIDATVAAQAKFRANCEQRHGELLPHVGTVDAARDLDIIRAAVGDERLTYLGFSYGTQLGATYATLFPDRIRALVLDAAVGSDLDATEVSKTQAGGFERAFNNFVDACRTDARCEAAPDARALYNRVRDAVEKQPIPVGTAGESRDLTVGDFQIGVVQALYDQALWFYLARGLADAATGEGATLLALADMYHQREPDGGYPNSTDANVAINCADTTERPTLSEVQAAARTFAADAPTFGAQLGWSTVACTGWPLAAEPQPDIATTTKAPILVVGTINDPATPYEWAQQLTKALGPTATLLTWQGEGHTAYLKARCVTEAVDTFLLELRLPAAETRCPADADRVDADFAGLQPDLAEAFAADSGLDADAAECVAAEVSDNITGPDLAVLYSGELSDSLRETITAAATSCQ